MNRSDYVARAQSPVPLAPTSSAILAAPSTSANGLNDHVWFYSTNEISSSTFTWRIENFSYYLGDTGQGRRFVSPFYTESLKSGEKYKWNLVLDPHYLKEAKCWVVLILETPSHRKVVQAKIKYSLLGAAGEVLHSEEYSRLNAFGPGLPTVWWKILRQDLLNNNKLYPNNSLTVRCEIVICNNPVTSRSKPDPPDFKVPDCSIVDDMTSLYESREHTDLVIRIGRKRFKAHKAILAARSDVFAAMFAHDMREKLESVLVIKDIDSDVFEEMLRFIYTGKVLHYGKYGLELLAAADKYGLSRLKALCEQEVALRVNEDNAAQVLFVADFHNSAQLRRYVIDYINSNPEQVINKKGWKMLLEQGMHIVPEIYADLARKRALPNKRQRLI